MPYIDTWTVNEIVEQLEYPGREFPAAAVEAAVRRRQEVTPRLLEILRETIADPDGRTADEDYWGHVLAAVLLTHLREPEAHRLLIELFSLPEEQTDLLWGDMITETLPGLLLGTCGGSVDAIRTMAEDDSVYVYCRGSALDALALAVGSGVADRRDTLDFMARLLRKAVEEDDYGLGQAVAGPMCDLRPQGHMDLVVEAYEAQVILDGVIGLESFEQALAEGEERALQGLRQRLEHALPETPEEYVACMGHFDPPRSSEGNPIGLLAGRDPSPFSDQAHQPHTGKTPAKSKRRRSVAKQSRKKNRGGKKKKKRNKKR